MFDKSVIHLYYRHLRGDSKIKSPLKWSFDPLTTPAASIAPARNNDTFEEKERIILPDLKDHTKIEVVRRRVVFKTVSSANDITYKRMIIEIIK